MKNLVSWLLFNYFKNLTESIKKRLTDLTDNLSANNIFIENKIDDNKKKLIYTKSEKILKTAKLLETKMAGRYSFRKIIF
jgi:hypothetical protein